MFKFEKIQLFGFEKEQEIESLSETLKELGVTIVQSPEEADLLIVLGGDGTILHQAKLAHQHQVPILGVNLGRIGFLADIDLSDINVIKAVLEGHCIEDPRQVLRCEVGNQIYHAINEIMICKSRPVRMIRYDVFVDDQFVYQQTADGLVVATTTGSSAYALSAGGQLVHPKVKALSLVPICPNKITSCPMILDQDAKIEVVLLPWKDTEAVIAVDAVEVKTEERIKITLDEKRITFLHPMDYDYYRTLQRKLHWEKEPG